MSTRTFIRIDATRTLGPVAALHGVNLGPYDQRWARDYSDSFRRARIPSVRLHDAALAQGEVADLHCIFPDPDADPDDPANYRFGLTDQYLAGIRDAGGEIYFRLGESIEHPPDKLFISPDRWDADRLATVCANIVRHYNQGWAEGHFWDIAHWEFWNEPESGWMRPPETRTCWGGDVDEFLTFYAAVSRRIKEVAPQVKVGLPGFAGGFPPKWLATTPDDRTSFGGWAGLLVRAVEAGLPVDFVSWHNYSGDWTALADLARQFRERLDEIGLSQAESHLGEWNYVPVLTDEDGEFSFMNSRLSGSFDRIEKSEAVLNGLAGAAFVFGTLTALQDARVDLAHFYTGISEPWGLFRLSGRPSPKYHAFEAFAAFVGGDAQRLWTRSEDVDRVIALAVRDGGAVKVGVARLDDGPHTIELDLGAREAPGPDVAARCLVRGPGGGATWEPVEATTTGGRIEVPMAGPGIVLLEMRG